MEPDNSKHVLDRINKANLVVLVDEKNIPLNVSFTEDGLKFTYDSKGRNLYDLPTTKVLPFKPDPDILKEKSFRAKCLKRWVDKGNALLYEQRN